jgi:hypothetical protein
VNAADHLDLADEVASLWRNAGRLGKRYGRISDTCFHHTALGQRFGNLVANVVKDIETLGLYANPAGVCENPKCSLSITIHSHSKGTPC